VDFLMPGIVAQTRSFGGFVTALSLADDLKKGLIDRFRQQRLGRGRVVAGNHRRGRAPRRGALPAHRDGLSAG
jgi:hypothetical protein